MLRTVQCWVWIEFRHCLLRASELTQPSLSNIIRHIYSRVQCKSKQSTCHWSCCIRILFVRHVNKHAVTSTGHIYRECMLVSSSKVLNCVNARCFAWQTITGGKKYRLQWHDIFVNRMHILLGNPLFTVWHINNVDPDSNICIVFNFSNCVVRSDDFNPTMFELPYISCFWRPVSYSK